MPPSAPDQFADAAFTTWLEAYDTPVYGPNRYCPDADFAGAVFSLADLRAAFSEGIRVADSLPAIRYDAQYRRRFLGGAKQAERGRHVRR